MLDSYEPGVTEAEIDALFDRLAQDLPTLVHEALERQAQQPAPLRPEGDFPIAAQAQLGRRLMGLAGFDFEHGRLDVSLHPFSGGTPDDVRITTRYEEADFTSSLMAVMHETGHALYELGLPAAWRRQPVGQSRGMAIHESQSLLIEMQACRSPAFLSFLAPLRGGGLRLLRSGLDGRQLPAALPSGRAELHRVDADEATYPLHVILRTRLEKAILAGDLAVADLPGAWDEGMQALLGLTPPDDRLGCLQDIHWYDGAWGYFPTYTLGAMTAAQFLFIRAGGGAGDPGGTGRRRFLAAGGLAAQQGAREGLLYERRRADRGRHRPPARSSGFRSASAPPLSW